MQNISRDLQFTINEDIGRVVVTVVDRTTGDVIRQIPQEEVVRLAERLAEQGSDQASGLLINTKGV